MYMKIHVASMLAKGVKHNSQTNTTNKQPQPQWLRKFIKHKSQCLRTSHKGHMYTLHIHQYIHVNEFTYSVTDVSVGYFFLTASPIRFSKSLATKLYHMTVGHVINVS